MKIVAPRLLSDLQEVSRLENMIEDGFVNHAYLNNLLMDYDVREFDGCHFKNVQFEIDKSQRISFVDCLFDHCDLSNLILSNVSLLRCHFKECRCTGLEITDSYMRDILFDSCLMTYANFSKTKTDHILYTQCDLANSSFNDMKFKSVEFNECTLTRSEFLYTPLKGLDMTTCQFDGIMITPNDLRGTIVSVQQAISLSQLLGIIIKE